VFGPLVSEAEEVQQLLAREGPSADLPEAVLKRLERRLRLNSAAFALRTSGPPAAALEQRAAEKEGTERDVLQRACAAGPSKAAMHGVAKQEAQGGLENSKSEEPCMAVVQAGAEGASAAAQDPTTNRASLAEDVDTEEPVAAAGGARGGGVQGEGMAEESASGMVEATTLGRGGTPSAARGNQHAPAHGGAAAPHSDTMVRPVAHAAARRVLVSLGSFCRQLPAHQCADYAETGCLQVGELGLTVFVRVLIAWMGLPCSAKPTRSRFFELGHFALAAALLICTTTQGAELFVQYGGIPRLAQLVHEFHRLPGCALVRLACNVLDLLTLVLSPHVCRALLGLEALDRTDLCDVPEWTRPPTPPPAPTAPVRLPEPPAAPEDTGTPAAVPGRVHFKVHERRHIMTGMAADLEPVAALDVPRRTRSPPTTDAGPAVPLSDSGSWRSGSPLCQDGPSGSLASSGDTPMLSDGTQSTSMHDDVPAESALRGHSNDRDAGGSHTGRGGGLVDANEAAGAVASSGAGELHWAGSGIGLAHKHLDGAVMDVDSDVDEGPGAVAEGTDPDSGDGERSGIDRGAPADKEGYVHGVASAGVHEATTSKEEKHTGAHLVDERQVNPSDAGAAGAEDSTPAPEAIGMATGAIAIDAKSITAAADGATKVAERRCEERPGTIAGEDPASLQGALTGEAAAAAAAALAYGSCSPPLADDLAGGEGTIYEPVSEQTQALAASMAQQNAESEGVPATANAARDDQTSDGEAGEGMVRRLSRRVATSAPAPLPPPAVSSPHSHRLRGAGMPSPVRLGSIASSAGDGTEGQLNGDDGVSDAMDEGDTFGPRGRLENTRRLEQPLQDNGKAGDAPVHEGCKAADGVDGNDGGRVDSGSSGGGGSMIRRERKRDRSCSGGADSSDFSSRKQCTHSEQPVQHDVADAAPSSAAPPRPPLAVKFDRVVFDPVDVPPPTAAHLPHLCDLLQQVASTPQPPSILSASTAVLRRLSAFEAMTAMSTATESLIGTVQQGSVQHMAVLEQLRRIAMTLSVVTGVLRAAKPPPEQQRAEWWWRQDVASRPAQLPRRPRGDTCLLKCVEHEGLLLRCTQVVCLPVMVVTAIVEARRGSAVAGNTSLEDCKNWRLAEQRFLGVVFDAVRVLSSCLPCFDACCMMLCLANPRNCATAICCIFHGTGSYAPRAFQVREPELGAAWRQQIHTAFLLMVQDFIHELSESSGGLALLMHERNACTRMSAALCPSVDRHQLTHVSLGPDRVTPAGVLSSHLGRVAAAASAWNACMHASAGSVAALKAMHVLLELSNDVDTAKVCCLTGRYDWVSTHCDSSPAWQVVVVCYCAFLLSVWSQPHW
jgi:hypothetical protein